MTMQVTIAYSPVARTVHEVTFTLVDGQTATEALQASGFLAEYPELATSSVTLGVWGRKVGLTHVLHDLDRLEVYRPLKVDPKVARHQRFEKQGTKRAGLFAKKRPGGKAGY